MSRADKTILIVDDEEMYRWNLEDFIEDEGYNALSVENGEKALELIQLKQIDLVVVDMRLPGMDGNTLILKAKRLKPDLKVLIHTGSVDYTLPEELKALHVNQQSVFYKPLEDMNRLLERIISETELPLPT